ncbi:MAG: glycosyltransferase family 2 protein [Cyclobacteriaceae bacterium]|nr:glycosyltransferase family 2 protein [Cyclobacteriaceae bacterium]
MEKVAIVLLNYNGAEILPKFLPSVVQWSVPYKIYLADNGSDDLSLDYVKKNFPAINIIALSENFGFCGGYNRALKTIESEYYILLNTDVEVAEGWVTPLLNLIERDANTAAVQPKILSWKNKNHFEYAGAAGGCLDLLAYPFCRGRIFDTLEADEGQYNEEAEIFWSSGACMMIRASAFFKAGGFDEYFFAHMEEIDLCWTLKSMGMSVRYCPNSLVWHLGAGTLATTNPKKIFLNFRNGMLLLIKHFPFAQLFWKLPLRWALDWLALFRFLAMGQALNAGAILKAHIDIIQNIGKWFKYRHEVKSHTIQVPGLYRRLIVLDYFVYKKLKYSDLRH